MGGWDAGHVGGVGVEGARRRGKMYVEGGGVRDERGGYMRANGEILLLVEISRSDVLQRSHAVALMSSEEIPTTDTHDKNIMWITNKKAPYAIAHYDVVGPLLVVD